MWLEFIKLIYLSRAFVVFVEIFQLIVVVVVSDAVGWIKSVTRTAQGCEEKCVEKGKLNLIIFTFNIFF